MKQFQGTNHHSFPNIAKRRWQWMLITKRTYLSKNAILKFIDFIKLWKSLSLKLKEGQIGLSVHCKKSVLGNLHVFFYNVQMTVFFNLSHFQVSLASPDWTWKLKNQLCMSSVSPWAHLPPLPTGMFDWSAWEGEGCWNFNWQVPHSKT